MTSVINPTPIQSSGKMNLFTPLADNLAFQMLESINEGRKDKDKYVAHFAMHEKGHIIYVAVNSKKEMLFNALTDTGELPQNISVCWRSWHHIKQEFAL